MNQEKEPSGDPKTPQATSEKKPKKKSAGHHFYRWSGNILLAVGLVFLVLGGLQWFKANQSSRWPMTKGKMVDSGFKEQNVVSRRNVSQKKSFKLFAEYRYTVDGNEYTSFNIDVGDPAPIIPSRSEAMRFKKPAGSEIQVYYNPNNPGQSALRTGVQRSTWVKLLIGLGGLVAFGASRAFM